MSYLSFYRPLLSELGQGHVFLTRSLSAWLPEVFFQGSLHDHWGRKSLRGFGDTDVHETVSQIIISSDLPGIKRENIKVYFQNDVLSLCGEREEKINMEDDVYGSMERVFGTVSKRIRLPHDTDYKRIKAIYEDGVLRITIPKPYTEKTVAQEIEIPVL